MSRDRRAFTLVELLVVIGIIAILVAILLPVLGQVRRQAAKAKCAAQMRELGHAMVMYAQENKQFLPPARLDTPYNMDGILYDKGASEIVGTRVNENVKWWHFLGRYLSKRKTMAQSGPEAAALRESVFWCPSFEGYTDTGTAVNLQGGINRNATGISMNRWPSYRSDYPDPATATDFPPAAEEFEDCISKNRPWYKLPQFTRPAERALLADGRQYYLEARRVAAGSAIPGQRLLFINNDYSAGVSGQSMLDFYRHGQYPAVENPDAKNGYHRSTGGKIGYNILYADNHVEAPTDRESGYRACRMRFPN
jgi:prepilin-type N-terminal cleavage/methylation domain-containing protein/prepilin-type processing-associated H-X9-DG protein